MSASEQAVAKAKPYRLGLRLDPATAQQVKDAAWRARQSVQAYVAQAIQERMSKEAKH